jgi:hypothetical protein
MADDPTGSAVKILPIKDDFPQAHFPTVYADSVSSIQPGTQTTKFYLARLEPSMKAENTGQIQPFAQVVMPTLSFVYSAAFFVKMIERMIEEGGVQQAVWDQALSEQAASLKKR